MSGIYYFRGSSTMLMRSRIVLILGLILLCSNTFAYKITGKLLTSDQWQPKVYLASIQAPDNLFVASPEFKINEATIMPDGTFSLVGSDLPGDPRFYRLYLVKNSLLSLEFSADSVRNFMHLLLSNSSEIELEAEGRELFDEVKVKGDEANQQIVSFEKDYFDKKRSLSRINTTAKRNFQGQSMNKHIREYAAECSDVLVGLFALYHLEDRETDFLRNSDFYFSFQDRLNASQPKSIYASAYNEMLNSLVGYRDLVCEIPKITKPWRTWVIWIEAFVILLLAAWIYKLKVKPEQTEDVDYLKLLTEKERAIWASLAAGKTNKEIAAELFIELSTVKTHINNLYKRLGVANRKEAIGLYNRLK